MMKKGDLLSGLLVWEFVLNLVSIILPTLSISTQTDKYNTAGINQEENAKGFYLFPYLLALTTLCMHPPKYFLSSELVLTA